MPYQSTNLLDFITPEKEQEQLMLRIIELDKDKKRARPTTTKWDEGYLDQEENVRFQTTDPPLKWQQSYKFICTRFDEQLQYYLRQFGPEQIRCVIVRDPSNRSHTRIIKHENQDSVLFDTRFGYYQFIKFKFIPFNHICAILPFLWFTIRFTWRDPLTTWIPEVNDTQTLKIFKLRNET